LELGKRKYRSLELPPLRCCEPCIPEHASRLLGVDRTFDAHPARYMPIIAHGSFFG